MTIPRSMMMLRFAFALIVGSAASTLSAQAGPPLARPPRDTQPTLRVPVSPSAAPSTVAPMAGVRAVIRASEPEIPILTVRPVSPPVDSVRPTPVAPAQVAPLDRGPTPPVPQAAPVAQQVNVRAALLSDVAPPGATARCKDGTFLSGALSADPCADHGGLAVRLPVSTPPRPPEHR